MSNELMTAEDVHILRLGLCLEPCTHADCERNHRVLATYHALAAAREDASRFNWLANERWWVPRDWGAPSGMFNLRDAIDTARSTDAAPAMEAING